MDPAGETRPATGSGPSTLALLVAGTLVVAGTATAAAVGSGWQPRPGPAAPAVTRPVAMAPAAPSGRADGLPPAGLAGVDAVAPLLAARADAVRSGRRDRWAATLDPLATGFRDRQVQAFDGLHRLPLARWSCVAVGTEAVAAPVPGVASLVVHARLRYRLAGDTRDVVREQYLTAVRRDGRWLLAGDADPRTQPALWDLGALTVARGRRSLVIGVAGPAVPLARTAADADAALAEVDRVWGRVARAPVVVVVPRTRALMAAVLDREDGAGLDQVAAVTTGEVGPGDGLPATGSPGGVADRVVLHPGAFVRLTPTGRRVVLTHELTHVVTRAAARVAPPLWVEEGFANYVAYRDSGLDPRQVAADVLPLVARGTAPAHLPGAADFDPDAGPIAPAYADAWLAFRLVSSGGAARAPAFYRAAAGLTGPPGATPAQALDRAFAALGTTPGRFEADWRAYRARLATGSGTG